MSKRALANQERAQQAERFSRLLRSSLLLAATLLSLGTVGLLAADQLYRPDAFVIEQLKIKGRFQHLQPQEIEQVVRQHQSGNFFSINLADIEQQIEKLAWVQNAVVRREWPNSLVIQVEEQRPLMRWGDDAWVNAHGEVVRLPNSDSLQAQFTLSGQPRDARKMLHQGLEWQRQLAESGLTLSALELSRSHSYQLQLLEQGAEQSFDLLLGHRDVQARLDRFLMLYDTRLSFAQQRLQRVDARYPDGLAISAREIENKPSSASTDEQKQ